MIDFTQAEAAGISEDAITAAESWTALVAMIQGESQEEAEHKYEASEPEKPWEPEKGQVYRYTPIDPKTKRKGKRSIEVEVTSVNKQAGTVTLVNNVDRKTVPPPAQAPFMKLGEIAGTPARAEQAEQRHAHEQRQEDDNGDAHLWRPCW